MSTFKGTSAEQDARYADKHKKLIASIKFPSNFDKKVDLTKVNMDVMREWITERIYQLLGLEDEVIPEYVFGILEESNSPDPKSMQVLLTGFLEDKTPQFMKELWRLLLSAQESLGGIPAPFVEIKKEEIRQKRTEDDKLQKHLRHDRDRYAISDSAAKRAEPPKDSGDQLSKKSSSRRMCSRSPPPRRRHERSRSRDAHRRDDRRRSRRSPSRSRSRDGHRRRRRSVSRSPPPRARDYCERRDDDRGRRTRSRSRSPRPRHHARERSRSRSRDRDSARRRDSQKHRSRSSSSNASSRSAVRPSRLDRRMDRRKESGDSDQSYEQQLREKVKQSLSSSSAK